MLITLQYVSMGGDPLENMLRADGTVIPGLYAAGIACGSHPEQQGLAYNGGLNQALVFGYRAGRHAAEEM